MIRTSAVATMLAMMVSACSNDQDATGPQMASAGDPAQSAVFDGVGAQAGHMQGIDDLVAAQTSAWAAKDAAAYAATYTVNAQMVNPVGGILVGREGIRAQHAFLFNPVNGPFRASTSTALLRRVTFLTGTLALVELDVDLTGYSGLPPGLQAMQPGLVRSRVSWVAVKRAQGWEIFHQQMTAIPPAM
jgi:uncharacterized protein (TIGR02246 family)